MRSDLSCTRALPRRFAAALAQCRGDLREGSGVSGVGGAVYAFSRFQFPSANPSLRAVAAQIRAKGILKPEFSTYEAQQASPSATIGPKQHRRLYLPKALREGADKVSHARFIAISPPLF